LVYHLQVEDLEITDISIVNIKQLGNKFIIPFLSPPNQKWPLFLSNIPGANFSSLMRTINSKKIDFEAYDSKITGEAKDHDSDLELYNIRDILRRIPQESHLHLVFTRKMKNSYFNKPAKSFEEEFSQSDAHLLRRSYWKVDTSKRPMILECKKGLPSGSESPKHVIFFLVHKSIKD
jgi:hypothetical protein